VVVDEAGDILLFRTSDPVRSEWGTWWITPGGGIDPGETVEAAAHRELAEETGLRGVDLGPVVRELDSVVPIDGRLIRQHETYFVVQVRRFTLDVTGWTDEERETVAEHRWWTLSDLRRTTDAVYPAGLADLVAEVLGGRKPA
jgi:8-oxo-dGTP pyrophosphatase MutT (NUDIX family)